MRIIIKWLLIGVVLYFLPQFLPGITVLNYQTALVFALVLTLLNYTIRPILYVLTLPINIITLGLFSIILNTIIFAITASLIQGFEVGGIVPAFFAAIAVSIAGHLIDFLFVPSAKND